MSDHEGYEAVYSAKQVADRLGVSQGMLRRYAAAYEEVTGQPITQHPRDGRRYTSAQVQALLSAKAFVRQHAGLSIDAALRAIMGQEAAETPPDGLEALAPTVDAQSLAHALTRPLQGELTALREQDAEALGELKAIRQALEALVEQGAPRLHREGPLVRLARWLEGWRQ